MTTITTLPAAPTRGDPATFAATADTFLSALPAFGTECNAVAAEMSRDAGIANSLAAAFMLPGYRGTSTSSVTFGTGTKVVTTQNNLLLVAGMAVTLSLTASATSYMQGTVTSYSGTTLTLSITSSNASGTYNDWQITPTNTNLQVAGAAVTTTALTTSSINGGALAGFKNFLINGCMRVAQRTNVSYNTTSSRSYLSCDRWARNTGSVALSSVSEEPVYSKPGGCDLSRAWLASTITSTGTGQIIWDQRIEAYESRKLYRKTVTFSVTVMHSNTGAMPVYLEVIAPTPAMSADSWSGYAVAGSSSTVNVAANTPTRLTLTVDLNSVNTSLVTQGEKGLGVTVRFGVTGALSAVTLAFTEAQLELGSSATPFEYRPIAIEDSLCKRYYYRVTGKEAVLASNYASAASQTFYVHRPHPVAMRVAPGVGVGSTTSLNVSGVITVNTSVNGLTFEATSNAAGVIYSYLQGSSSISCNAEL